MINSPSIRQIRIAPTGHLRGIPASITANDDPINDITHKSCVPSIESGVTEMTVPLIIPFGNNGLNALSVSLA